MRASVMIQELGIHHSELFLKMKQLPLDGTPVSLKDYRQLPNISIDYAVMEKTDKAAVLPSDFGWSDIGSWKSLYDFTPKDTNGNVIEGDVISENTQNSLIMGHERLIAANKIKNMVVVETPDAVFVSDLENSRDVKLIVEKLKEKGRSEYQKHKTSYHLWGTLTVLETSPDFSVVRRDMYPGSKCEIKTDSSTVKHLIVTKGVAKSTINSQSRLLNTGQSLILKKNQMVVLENSGGELLIVIGIKTNSIPAD
jgi:mannose-1-phosphate guanylyltransferase/mannose-6-phosphate isomerase